MKSFLLVLAAALNTGVFLATSREAFAQNQSSAIMFRVIDDRNNGVLSEILLVKPDGSSSHFKDTGSDGIAKADHPCRDGEQFFAKPKDFTNFRNSQMVDCGKLLTLKVTSHIYYGRLELLRDRAVERLRDSAAPDKDHGKAALVYNELYVRTSASDPKLSEGYRVTALREAAKSLNVETPTVQSGGHTVMSPSFRNTVADFQRKSGIEGNGELNYNTLRSLAGVDIGAAVAGVQ